MFIVANITSSKSLPNSESTNSYICIPLNNHSKSYDQIQEVVNINEKSLKIYLKITLGCPIKCLTLNCFFANSLAAK